jgi:hypothetical protein
LSLEVRAERASKDAATVGPSSFETRFALLRMTVDRTALFEIAGNRPSTPRSVREDDG